MLKRARGIFRNLLRKEVTEQALRDELQSCVDILTEEKKQAGLSTSEARRQALLELGGVEQIKEEVRSVRAGRLLEEFGKDVHFGLRSFRAHKAFTCTAVLTLGLGIAAATSVMSIVDATLFRALPFPESNRVVDIGQVNPKRPELPSFGIQRNQSEALRSSSSFESVTEYASYVSQPYTVAQTDGAFEINGMNISPDFFKVFRVRPARGRVFTAEDENTEQPGVAILTSTGLQRLFNGQRDVIGKRLSFVEGQVTVVGVMGDRFWFPMVPGAKMGRSEPSPDLLLPWARRSESEGPESLHVVAARLKSGVTVAQAQTEAQEIARRYDKPNRDGSMPVIRVRLLQQELGSEARATLLTLFGVVGCLLLLCCVNIANLLLSHSCSRTRELALRATLGAGRARIFRQLLTECLVLAAIGGLVGLYLTAIGMETFVRLLPKGLLLVPKLDLDARMLGIAVLVTLVTGLLSGLGPAIFATRADLANALKTGGQPNTRTPRWRSLGSTLLVVEASVLLVLLSGGALLVNTLVRLKNIDLGFDSGRLWTAEFFAPKTLYAQAAQVGSLAGRMADTVRRLPGVSAVGESDWGLLGGYCPSNAMTIPGNSETLKPQIRHVSAGYFDAVEMGLRSGRIWTAQEENVKPQVVVINSAAARQYWPNEDPIGRRITVNKKWPVQIVGVVTDLREANEREAPGPSIYVPLNPFSTRFYNMRTLVVRTGQVQTGLGQDAVKALAAIDPRLPVTMTRADETLSVRRQDSRFYAVFVGLAAAFGLLLAAVGIAGVTAQGVAQRTKEIGVRLALGADVACVIGMVIRQVCMPVMVGIVLGIGGALAAARVLKSFLYEITPHDPVTHAIAAAMLLGIALLAAYLPARRAARIDPVNSLRAE
jgi:putative ABC transport system permease protein